MTESTNEFAFYAVPYEFWSASLRIISKENERLDDVYIAILTDHMRVAENSGQFRLMRAEDYLLLLETLETFCESFERPYVQGILASLRGARQATVVGRQLDGE